MYSASLFLPKYQPEIDVFCQLKPQAVTFVLIDSQETLELQLNTIHRTITSSFNPVGIPAEVIDTRNGVAICKQKKEMVKSMCTFLVDRVNFPTYLIGRGAVLPTVFFILFTRTVARPQENHS